MDFEREVVVGLLLADGLVFELSICFSGANWTLDRAEAASDEFTLGVRLIVAVECTGGAADGVGISSIAMLVFESTRESGVLK